MPVTWGRKGFLLRVTYLGSETLPYACNILSSHADQEYIYFMSSETSPSLRCKLHRKCFLLPVTYFSSNLKYPFTLRVTVIVNTGISLLNHFLILVMVAFYLYTVKRTKLLNTQRIRVVSALRERKLGECSRNEFGEYKEREF